MKVFPVVLAKDAMQIKPGLLYDSRQGKLIGSTINIDYKFVRDNPEPDNEMMKKSMVQEAEVSSLTTVLPIGVRHLSKGGSSAESAATLKQEMSTFEKVVRNGNECSKVHSLTMFENSLMFTDTGDHSIKVFNPVTGECTPYLAHGKGIRDGKSAQFVQPAGLISERRTVFIVDCSTGYLRMVSDVSPLVKYLENLRVCYHIWFAPEKAYSCGLYT